MASRAAESLCVSARKLGWRRVRMQRAASACILTWINSESDECSCHGRWLLRCFTHKLPIYCQLRGTYPSDHDDVLGRPKTRARMLWTTPLRPTQRETLVIQVGCFRIRRQMSVKCSIDAGSVDRVRTRRCCRLRDLLCQRLVLQDTPDPERSLPEALLIRVCICSPYLESHTIHGSKRNHATYSWGRA
jgi:hypothetical protein